MKKSLVLALIIGLNLLFLFIYIYKASQCLHQSYCKQELEHTKKKVEQKKQSLVHQMYQLKSRDAAAQFAQHTLHMEPVRITQVKKVKLP